MVGNYYHYIPWKSRMSPFWDNDWLSWDVSDTESPTGGSLGDASALLYFGSYPAGACLQ